MRLRSLILSIAVLTGSALPAQPARALSGECLWQTVPEARRQQMLDNFRSRGLSDSEPFTDADIANLSDCGVTEESQFTAVQLLAGYLLLQATTTVLSERHGIEPADLDKAWRELDGADRRAIETFMSAGERKPTAGEREAMNSALERFVTRVTVKPAAMELAVSWAMGRGMVSALERVTPGALVA